MHLQHLKLEFPELQIVFEPLSPEFARKSDFILRKTRNSYPIKYANKSIFMQQIGQVTQMGRGNLDHI
jgi:hypothetical protein